MQFWNGCAKEIKWFWTRDCGFKFKLGLADQAATFCLGIPEASCWPVSFGWKVSRKIYEHPSFVHLLSGWCRGKGCVHLCALWLHRFSLSVYCAGTKSHSWCTAWMQWFVYQSDNSALMEILSIILLMVLVQFLFLCRALAKVIFLVVAFLEYESVPCSQDESCWGKI